MTTRAILFGATGLIGSQLLQQALAAGDLAITAPTRKPLGIAHPRLENPVVDFARLENLAGTWDVAFSCLGTTLKQAGGKAGFYAVDHDLAVQCARFALQHGARHLLVVSAIGVGAKSPVYYNRVKAETETDLRALGYERLTLMQPSLLLGERGGPSRPGEALAIRLSPLISPLMVGPLAPYTPIQGADVAAAMLARAKRPAAAGVEHLRYRDMMALAGR